MTPTTTDTITMAGSDAATPTPTTPAEIVDPTATTEADVPKMEKLPATAANVLATAVLNVAASVAAPPTTIAPATPAPMARASSVLRMVACPSAERKSCCESAAPYAVNWLAVGGRGGPASWTPPTRHCGPGSYWSKPKFGGTV